jgi:FAD/FMN-containing dehydrogenase
MSGRIASFGGVNQPVAPRAIDAAEALAAFSGKRAATFLPYGNGRSYGDTCLTSRGVHADMRAMNRIIDLDLEQGIVTAEPGVMLGDLIAQLRGTGWFPPVVPGTQFITLGGALANDIHGKNHHGAGTFGCHVSSFRLLRSDGKTFDCSPAAHSDLYAATIGGLGLTGIVTQLRLKLMRAPAHDISALTIPFAGLGGYFDLSDSEAEGSPYAVAWIDQLATGRKAGRGLMMLGRHADNDAPLRRKLPLTVPFQPPIALINPLSLRAFNTAYFAAGARKRGWTRVPSQSFFFPLDAVGHWNRLYGPRGLFQHQSVIPLSAAREVISRMLAATRAAGEASFLTVLKKFGALRSPGLMSFPREGHTLTLDFPNRGSRTLALLERLDAMVVEAGGAVNPYKDARMSLATFKACFPQWEALETLRDPAILSDFWTRTALSEAKTR